MRAASSRSLFVMVPAVLSVVLSAVFSCACISGGKGEGHSIFCGMSLCRYVQQPPIPSFDASIVPTMCGECGTMVWIGTAILDAVLASSTQSFNIARKSGIILM